MRNRSALLAALLVLAGASVCPAEVINIGSVQGDGAIGTGTNSTGGFNVVGTSGVQQIVVSSTITSSFPGDAQIRLTGPGGSPVLDVRVSPTGVPGGTLVFSGVGLASNAPLNGAWTYECFDSFPDAGIDWTATGMTIDFQGPIDATSFPTETMTTYVSANSGASRGVLASLSASNGPLGWMEAKGALANPVVFSTAPVSSNGPSAWAQDGFANVGSAGAIRANIFGTTFNDWFISPLIDFGSTPGDFTLGYNLALTTFNGTAATSLGTDDSFVVLISDDGGSTWSNLPANVLKTYTSSDTISNTGQTESLSISSISGKRRIAFAGFSSVSNADNDLFIDNVSLAPALAFSVDVSQADPDSSVQRDTSAFYTLNIANTGTTADTYTVTATGGTFPSTLFEADQVTPLPATVNVSGGGSHVIELRVDVPLGATIGQTSAVVVQAAGSATDSVTVTTTAAEFNFGGGTVAEGNYFFANSEASASAPSKPAFNWVDISGTGTDIIGSMADDGANGPHAIGFPFNYMGAAVSTFYVQDNGFITFDSSPGTGLSTNGDIPSVNPPNNAALWFWDDLDATDPDVTNKHLYIGTSGGNRVITWEKYPRFNAGIDPDAWISAQIILRPNGNILMQYNSHGASMPLNGATIGLENSGGTAGISYQFDGGKGPLVFPMALEFGLNAAQLTGVSSVDDWMLR